MKSEFRARQRFASRSNSTSVRNSGSISFRGQRLTLENGNRAHVRHERVVTERDASLGHKNVAIARTGDLRDDVRHVPRSEELAFLDIDDLAGFRRSYQQIGLPAQEGRNLQHINGRRDPRTLLRLMHIGENRNFELVADFGKNRQGLIETEPACRPGGRAVGLVERRLVDEANSCARRDLLQGGRHLQRMRFALQSAWTCDQRHRQIIAEAHGADRHGRVRLLIHGFTSSRRTMKGRNAPVNGPRARPPRI